MVFSGFREFLKEYNLVSMTIAFMMGLAAQQVVKSFVDNLIMPTITPFIPRGEWQGARLIIGAVELRWGSFLSAVINFLIVAIIIYIIVKKLIERNKIG